MIQLQSDNGLATTACLSDLCGTIDVPHPAQLHIAAVRTFWNNFRRLRHLPVIDDVFINFRYVSPHHPVFINDDASLRFAYRTWLSLCNPRVVLILFVNEI